MVKGVVRKKLSPIFLDNNLLKKIRDKQQCDEWLMKVRKIKEDGTYIDFDVSDDGSVKFKGRWCVPKDFEIKEKFFRKAHCLMYSVHLGVDKLYKDLKKSF